MNLAAHFGRWSAKHRKAAIVCRLGFVLAVFVLGNAIGTKNLAADTRSPSAR
jgi:hypothetical protein